jgi:predicted transglutaminase-like cysteine proteinase
VLATSSHFDRLIAANDARGGTAPTVAVAVDVTTGRDQIAMLAVPVPPAAPKAEWYASTSEPETDRARAAVLSAAIDLRAGLASAPIVNASLAVETPVPAPPQRGPTVFGSIPIVAPDLPISRVFQRAFTQRSSDGIPGCAQGRAQCIDKLPSFWQRVVMSTRDLSRDEQLAAINRTVNHRIAYREDIDAHGQLDVWSTPHEIMAAGAGDCEDYAILKMHLLSLIGVATEDMHVVVVRADHLAAKHAVLVVRQGNEALILDNLNAVVRQDRAQTGYVAMFSINAGGFWIHGAPAGPRTKLAERSARLSR